MPHARKIKPFIDIAEHFQSAVSTYQKTGDDVKFKQSMAALRTNHGKTLGKLVLK